MDEIYDDLINIDIEKYKERIDELELHINKLNDDIQTLCIKIVEMRETQTSLVANISVLYKTAKCEIERKDRMVVQLRKEKDEILCRRSNFIYNKRPHSPSTSIESKRSRSNQERQVLVQECKEISKNIATTSENKHGSKSNEVIEINKDAGTSSRSIPKKNEVQASSRRSREKEQDGKSKEHKDYRTSKNKGETSSGNYKEKAYSKHNINIDGIHNKDRRRSPIHKNKANETPKVNMSKSRADNNKRTSVRENCRSPRSHSTIKSTDSSKSSTEKCIPRDVNSLVNLRDKLISKSKHERDLSVRRSTSSEKYSFKAKEVQMNFKKSSVPSGNKIIALKGADLEEGEITDESLVDLTSGPENIEKINDYLQNEIDRSKNINDDLSLVKSKQTPLTSAQTCIEASEVPGITKNLQSTSQETKTIFFDMKATDLPCGNVAETRINEDNIVELHIHPKSGVSRNNDAQVELLLTQLEEGTNMNTSVVFKSPDNAACGGSNTENRIEIEQQQNNENVNTSNNLDMVLPKDEVSPPAIEVARNTSSSSGRRRRRAIVFIS